MASWFECSISYNKINERGINAKVTEKYLVDALSFTEAEARITKERAPFVSGEGMVAACKRTKIAEVFEADVDRFYLAKMAFITLDDKTGAERRSITQMLVGGEDLIDAIKNLNTAMRGTMADWELVAISETPILEIYKH
jgi:hypothetical protein